MGLLKLFASQHDRRARAARGEDAWLKWHQFAACGML